MTSGRTLESQGPQAKAYIPPVITSPSSATTPVRRPPRASPGLTRAMRTSPPSCWKTWATDSMARRARTTPAPGS